MKIKITEQQFKAIKREPVVNVVKPKRISKREYFTDMRSLSKYLAVTMDKLNFLSGKYSSEDSPSELDLPDLDDVMSDIEDMKHAIEVVRDNIRYTINNKIVKQ